MKILTLIVISLVLSVTAAPAVADDARIGLSADGRSWSLDLPAPLFDPDVRWVPGDRRTRSFYVRNEDPDPALLSVDVLGSSSDSLLETGDLTIYARGGGGQWRDVTSPGEHRLVSWVGADSGEPRRVDVEVAFDPTSTNRSMTRDLDLRLRVTLRQDDAAAPLHGADLLPDTGGPAFLLWVVAGALVATGLAVARTRRQGENRA